jgi:hypothetical protein
MHHVLGYDTAGRELFSLDVEAVDEQDAKLIALRELRRTPDGVHKANHAQDCQSACKFDPPYCLICECYQSGNKEVLSSRVEACSRRGPVGGSGPS